MSKPLFAHFESGWQRRRCKTSAKYPFIGGKHGKMLKDLRDSYSDADLALFMDTYFIMDDPFFEQVIAFVNRKGSEGQRHRLSETYIPSAVHQPEPLMGRAG